MSAYSVLSASAFARSPRDPGQMLEGLPLSNEASPHWPEVTPPRSKVASSQTIRKAATFSDNVSGLTAYGSTLVQLSWPEQVWSSQQPNVAGPDVSLGIGIPPAFPSNHTILSSGLLLPPGFAGSPAPEGPVCLLPLPSDPADSTQPDLPACDIPGLPFDKNHRQIDDPARVMPEPLTKNFVSQLVDPACLFPPPADSNESSALEEPACLMPGPSDWLGAMIRSELVASLGGPKMQRPEPDSKIAFDVWYDLITDSGKTMAELDQRSTALQQQTNTIARALSDEN